MFGGNKIKSNQKPGYDDPEAAKDCMASENIYYDHNARWGQWYSRFFVMSVREISA